MAIKIPVTLPSGASGNYIRIGVIEWSKQLRSAYAELVLFKDEAQATAAPRFPLAVVAILNLRNDVFDRYLSRAALEAAGGDVLARLYTAAKEQPLSRVNDLALVNLANAEDV